MNSASNILLPPSQLSKKFENGIINATQALRSALDEDEIVLSIEQDDNLKVVSSAPVKKTLDINELTALDNGITEKIDLANKLWVLKGFIDQLSTDLVMNEFESIFYNLNKLQAKLKEFEKSYMSSLILDKIGMQIIEFETRLDSNIEQLILREFWEINDDSICLKKSIEINDYSELTYEELIEVLENNSKTNPSHFNKKLSQYLNLNIIIDEKLIQPLINDQFDLELASTDKYSKLVKIPKVDSIYNYTTSLIECITFINAIPNNKSLRNFIIKPILNSLEKKLLEDNVELLISDPHLKELALKLSSLLDENNWFNKGENILQNWVNDSINYWIDKKFKDSLKEIRSFKINLLHDEGIFAKLSEIETDSWNWKEEAEETNDDAEKVDDDWDAWDNEDDDLFDGDDELKNDHTEKEHYQISPIPQLCYEKIILPFLQLSLQIKELNIEGLLILRLKDLLTDLFIILSDLYSDKKYPILFFNDFQRILELIKAEEIANSLNVQLNNYLSLVINEFKLKFIKIWTSSIRDIEELEDEDASEAEIFLIEFNDYIKHLNELIDLNYSVNSKITNILAVSTISFILEFLIKRIFSMSMISEKSSIAISSFQKSVIKILKKTKHVEIAKLRNFNKFEKISIILNDNLKKIESSFNDGEFFDFETKELIQLIQLLFVDSELRNELIEYISEVRNAE